MEVGMEEEMEGGRFELPLFVVEVVDGEAIGGWRWKVVGEWGWWLVGGF